ncbi:hypothetical protein LCGC14_1866960, partial [marine sediment metagenome]
MRNLLAIIPALLLIWVQASAAMVADRWGVAGHVQHPGTLIYEVRPEGTLMRFDLSALPARAKVHAARLAFVRSGLYGSGFDIVPAEPDARADAGGLKISGRPLRLLGPHWQRFDATKAVRGWVAAGRRTGRLLIRKGPKFADKATWLEIAYEGRPKSPPRQVTGTSAFYRSGQVFITFREIEQVASGKVEITWGELSRRFSGITTQGPIPRDDKGEIRYRVYAHDKPITPASIGEASLLAEVVPGSGYNTRLVPRGDWIKRRPKALAARLAVEPGKPLPPGVGLYVHTVGRAGQAWYAVLTAVNGATNGTDLSPANVVGPVTQKRSAPEPVLQREKITKLRKGGAYHEKWYSLWAVPPIAPRPLRYDLAVGLCPDSMSRPASLTFTRGHTWGPNPEMPRASARRGVVMSMSSDPPNGFWTGVNDARGTLKGIEQGLWRPFTHDRQEALIGWAQRKWQIDPQRIVGAIGAWGMWEIKRADLYSYIHGWGMPEVTKGFQCINWARGAWGPPEAYKGKPDDANPWVVQDYTSWVLANPGRELPYFQIHTGWGAHFTEMGWPPFPRFIRAMIDTKRAFCMQSAAVSNAIRDGTIVFRRDRSVPAFGNCSLDDNIGEGDLNSGRAFGQVNGYLLWESASTVDEPGLWELTVWLSAGDSRGRGAAPLDRCSVDLTPRRCRRFKAKPGEKFTWTNTTVADGKVVQSGAASADKGGLVTLGR